jgi:hypothetical protein
MQSCFDEKQLFLQNKKKFDNIEKSVLRRHSFTLQP